MKVTIDKKHKVIIGVAIVFLAGVLFLLVKKLISKKEVDLNTIPSVNVTHVHRGSIEKEISVMGSILPNDTYYVPVKVAGDIKKIYVNNGDHVKKGDPICEIDASKEIKAAFIQYDTARKSYDRMRRLYNAGDISLQNFESVKAQYDAAKLQYDTKVEYATPVAVGDGVVENTDMTINTSVSVGKVLCYITSNEAKEINFGVTERVLSGISLGDKVIVEKAGETYDGYISSIASLINSTSGLFNVKAVITSKNSFASGIMAKVTFVYDKRRNVNILPNELIYYEGGVPYIYTVGDDNIIKKEYIEVGLENERISEVYTNIDKKTRIVSTWNNSLAEGTLVNVVKDEEVYDEIDLEEEVKKAINETTKVPETIEDLETTDAPETVLVPETTKETEATKTNNSIKEDIKKKTNNSKKIVETSKAINETADPLIVEEESQAPQVSDQLPLDVKITEVK